MTVRHALLAVCITLMLAACGKGLQKAPQCKGTYVPVNAPEHYLKDAQP